MSLIPDFELGLWNAWIFMFPHVLTFPLLLRLGKEKDVPSLSDGALSRATMAFCVFSKVIYFPSAVYSIFVPLKLGTWWFYVDLPVTLIALATYMIVLVNWLRRRPVNQL